VFDPKTQTWEEKEIEVSNRRAGYDICLSAPKSVSLYLAMTDDKDVERMLREAADPTRYQMTLRFQGADSAAGWRTSPVTVALSPADALSGIASTQYRVDGGAFQSGTSISIPAPADHSNDGAHAIQYQSTDSAGNVEPLQSATVRIDTTLPAGALIDEDAVDAAAVHLDDVEAEAVHRDAVAQNFRKAANDCQRLRCIRILRAVGQLPDAQLRDQRCVPGQNAQAAVSARKRDFHHRLAQQLPLRRNDDQLDGLGKHCSA